MGQERLRSGLLTEREHDEIDKALELTEKVSGDKKLPALFEPTFEHDRILAHS